MYNFFSIFYGDCEFSDSPILQNSGISDSKNILLWNLQLRQGNGPINLTRNPVLSSNSIAILSLVLSNKRGGYFSQGEYQPQMQEPFRSWHSISTLPVISSFMIFCVARTFWVERHLDVVLKVLQVVGSKFIFYKTCRYLP